MSENLERIYELAKGVESFARHYIDYLNDLLKRVDSSMIARFIDVLLDARDRHARIFFCGNGGSASTCSHFANDLLIGLKGRGTPFLAVSLCDNPAIMTSIANDHGYDHIFSYQLKQYMKEGDVVVAISASGASPNVIEAVEYGNQNGATTMALTGFDGGKLKKIAQVTLHVPSCRGEYGPTEDIHLIIDHLVSTFLRFSCATQGE
jgi:D-sedoheptulose 7-phosphate isomerase